MDIVWVSRVLSRACSRDTRKVIHGDSSPVLLVRGVGGLGGDTRGPNHGGACPEGGTMEDSFTVRPVEEKLKGAGSESIPVSSSPISTLAARIHGEGGECGGGGAVGGCESRDEEIRLGEGKGDKAADGGHGAPSSGRTRSTAAPSDSVPEMGRETGGAAGSVQSQN
jgi:hypothetical protein